MKKILLIASIAILFVQCNNSGGWPLADQQKGLKACMDAVQGRVDEATAKKYCSCALQKTMQKYKTYAQSEAETDESIGQQIGKACMEELKMGGDDQKKGGGGILGGGMMNKSNWTDEQRQQYIQGCAITAQQAQGMTPQQAFSYCDCMTRKVEQKYSFEEAGRLTTADLQTEEWIKAANECRSQLNNQ